MSISCWYLAAPVGAPTTACVDANLARAGRWLAWLLEHEPDVAITAPWLATMLARVQDDMNPEHRARGMRDNLEIARCLDGIVLVGGRISPGMKLELDAVIDAGGWVADLTCLGEEPPNQNVWALWQETPIALGMRRWGAL